jgi:hypothetical protein
MLKAGELGLKSHDLWDNYVGKIVFGQAWWYTDAIPEVRKLRQED